MEIDGGDDEESANPPGFNAAADEREALLAAPSQQLHAEDDGKTSDEDLATGVAKVDLEDQPMAEVEHEQNGAHTDAPPPVAEQAKSVSLVGSGYDSDDEVAQELVGAPSPKVASKPEEKPEDASIPLAAIKPTLITPSSRPPGPATPPPEPSTSRLARAHADQDSASERLAAQLETANDPNMFVPSFCGSSFF